MRNEQQTVDHESGRRRPTVYMTVGLPGSGKSTWAKALVQSQPPGRVVRVNKDDLRAMLHSSRHAGRTTELLVRQARDNVVVDALEAGRDVVVDDTNLNVSHEGRLRELAALYGADFVVQSFLDVDVDECIRRDAQRTGTRHVGAVVIRRMAREAARRGPVRMPLVPAPYIAPAGAPTCVIVDVDGTLALMDGRGRHDLSRVGDDLPNKPVVDLTRTLLAAGETVIVMSGREAVCRPETKAWLAKHVAPGLPLFMRNIGDRRPDSFVKYDLFNAHVAGRYRVRFVLDDRDQVVRLWRRIFALTCMQVAEGAF